MKNFLRKYLGFNDLQEANNILSNKIAEMESNLKEELMDDLGYDLERQVEQQVDSEVDDRLYNYDFEEMKDKIEMLAQDSSDFDHQISAMTERIDALDDKLNTLSILDRLSALEAKIQ